MVLYTSGTTGRPKGVLHSHDTLTRAVLSCAQHWGIMPGDAILMPSPVTHVSGYSNGLELPFLVGTRTVLMESWNAEIALDLIERHAVRGTVAATPFLQELVARAPEAGTRLPSMTFFACGGAAVPAAVVHKANALFGKPVAFRVFGSSEVPLVTLGYPRDAELAATTDGEVIDYEVRVIDDHGHPAPARRRGGDRGARALRCSWAMPTRARPARRSTPTASSAPATSASSPPTARSPSPGARRT
jgi:acyl-coenzyme A synthetase/AMP-(fatty) acid ligase